MPRLIAILLSIMLVGSFAVAFADGSGTGSGSGSGALTAAGSGSVATPAPVVVVVASDKLHDPAEAPAAAWDDVKASKKVGWPLAVFAALLMLTKALAYSSVAFKATPVLGAAAKWLALDKHAMWVTGVGTLAAVGYNVLIGGGTLVAALFAAAVSGAGLVHSTTQPPKSS